MTTRVTRSSAKRASSQLEPSGSTTSANVSNKRSKPNEDYSRKHDIDTLPTPDEALKIVEETGDFFNAPANTLLIHACNCNGSWGGGIAKAFKQRYPKAYEQYTRHCDEFSHSLLDSAQLIPPLDAYKTQSGDGHQDASPNRDETTHQDQEVNEHFVGCLFTSRHYGRKKDSPSHILKATKPAMEDLMNQIYEWNAKATSKADRIAEVRMCKINSGLFNVPWEKSKRVLESIDVKDRDVKVIKVVSPSSG